MRFLKKLIIVPVLFGLPTISLYAAVNVYSGMAQSSNAGFNPYTVFSASGNNANNSADADSVTSPPQAVVPVAASPKAGLAQQAIPASPSIKYIQPATQTPKAYAPPQIIIKPLSPVQPNAAQNNPTIAPAANNLPASTSLPVNSDPAPAASQNSAFLQQIANSTAATQTSAAQIAANWQSSSSQDQQWLQAITDQNAFSSINAAVGAASTSQGQLASNANANLVSLQGDWSNPSASLQDSFSYLSSITPASLQNSETDDLWTPAVNTALTDLSTEEPVIAALGQMVNAPFAAQSGVLANLQNASSPELLKALVIESAVNNQIAYQMLQRQQDQEVMQASMLAMLTAINNNIENGSSNEVAQIKRIVDAMYDLNKK